MIYNELSCDIDIDYNKQLCNRAELETGHFCNYNCSFCYYKDDLNDPVLCIDNIYKRVDFLVSCGITEVDLSGGESSIHPNWFDILDYCEDKGLRCSTLSNGSKFCDIEFLKKSKEHGLKEILFSLHGYDEKSHDDIVGRVGAFKKIKKAIYNAHKLDIIVRINCTVTDKNYFNLEKLYIPLIHELGTTQINFITLNLWGDETKETIDYLEVGKHLKRCIVSLEETMDCDINVRYIPFCYMEGYEEYCVGYYQHIYDLTDWNISMYICRSNADMIEYLKNKYIHMHNTAKKYRLSQYYKKRECFTCKWYKKCDGFEKNKEK